MMAYTLSVWLYGTLVSELSERRTGRLTLEYTNAALERWPSGTPLLSVALRTRPDRRQPPSIVTPYFEGLLPEGAARNLVEDRFGVRRGDIFGLLAAIGRDCAGAVVSRVHQEDMCQALSIPVDFSGAAKYEESGGPSFAKVASILDGYAADPVTELEKLVSMMAFTVVIGNADAHGKNLSLLHRTDGSVALAPVYDAMCTTWYHDVVTPQGTLPISTKLAMSVNGVRDLHDVTRDDLVSEAVTWRVGATRAREVVDVLLERLKAAADQAANESSVDVGELAAFVAARAVALQTGMSAGVARS